MGILMDAGPARGWTEDLETIDDLVWYAPRERLRSALIAGVEAVWTELCQGEAMPRKSAIDPVDWTKAHDQRKSDTKFCQFLSRIEDSKFVPVFSKPGKPFVCAVVTPNGVKTEYSA